MFRDVHSGNERATANQARNHTRTAACIGIMFVIDDPLMALILRLVVDTEDQGSNSNEFLQRQLKAMRHYLALFPQQEHAARAMEWIGQHAERYRRDWERNTLANRTVYLRCADCPLANLGASQQCEIHEQWLYLLHRYLAEEVTTRRYIEDSLALLRTYKEQHRLRVSALEGIVAKNPKKEKPRPKKKDRKKKKKKGKKKKASTDDLS
jgi:hypothetical protein